MSSNIRGFNSKKEILANIITAIEASFIFLQETHMYNNSQIKIPGFYSFSRHRPKMGSKGGIAILVAEEFKNDCVLIHEGKEAEILAIKVCSIYPNLCLINYYGRQENTTPPGEICNHLSEVVLVATCGFINGTNNTNF